MPPTAKLYWFSASHPAQAVRRMLDRKGLDYTLVGVVPGMQRIQLRLAGFRHGTVPALKLAGRRVQGTRRIARALEQVRPEPPLFPADAVARARHDEIERWGDEVLQMVPRRIMRWGTVHDSELRRWIGGQSGVPALGVAARLSVVPAWYYARVVSADEATVRRSLEELPADARLRGRAARRGHAERRVADRRDVPGAVQRALARGLRRPARPRRATPVRRRRAAAVPRLSRRGAALSARRLAHRFGARRGRAGNTAMSRVVAVILVAVFALPATAAAHHKAPRWKPVPTGSDQQYRGLDAVDKRIAWVGGSAGEVLRTTDGGSTWKDVSPPDSAGLLFRDVEARERAARERAVDRRRRRPRGSTRRPTAAATGGLAFVNDDPAAFYDCMDFFDGGRRGLALSDPVDGKFRIAATDDCGRSWHVLPTAGMPPAVDGEFAFAASGTCLVTSGARRLVRQRRRRRARVPLARRRPHLEGRPPRRSPPAEAGGVFSLAFRNPREGVMVGGDFTAPDNGVDASGFTRDGGAIWRPGGDLSGYRSGVDWVSGSRATLIAVGPTGSDVSYDGGAPLDARSTPPLRRRRLRAAAPAGRAARPARSRCSTSPS